MSFGEKFLINLGKIILMILIAIAVISLFMFLGRTIFIGIQMLSGETVNWDTRSVISVICFLPTLALFFTFFDENM